MRAAGLGDLTLVSTIYDDLTAPYINKDKGKVHYSASRTKVLPPLVFSRNNAQLIITAPHPLDSTTPFPAHRLQPLYPPLCQASRARLP